MGRVLSRTLPMGQRETFAYDVHGNPTRHTDFNGQTTVSEYDSLNRLTDKTYADGIVETWTYDAASRVTQTRQTIDGNTEVTTYAYDAQDRLTTETQPSGSQINYGYDEAGNRTTLTTTVNGVSRTVNYTFDALNRLATVTDLNGTTTYAYDAAGNRESVTQANEVTTRYRYDSLNRLTELQSQNSSDVVLTRFTYTLGATGRREKIEELSGRVTDYVYDDLYRLTGEHITDPQNGNYTANYQYDLVGNRTYSTIDGVQTAYSYDANDRLTQQGGTTYAYDANGNTLSESEDGQATTYIYDARNKMVSSTNANGASTYAYNINGIRTQKTEAGVTTNYLVDHNQQYAQVLVESEGNVTTKQYTYGDDLLSQSHNGNSHFYLYDGLGSTRALADASGVITDEYFYEAFGELLASTGTTDNSYRFTGEQYDSTLSQYYLRARYYDQGAGRFTQQDTWMGNNSDPVTLHKYLYANADPANGTDPSGYMTLIGVMRSFDMMGALSKAGYHAAGVSLAESLLVLSGDSSRVDSQVTPTDIVVARVKAKSCVQNGNDDCRLGIPTVIFGVDMWDATNHYWDAQTMMGLPQVLNRGAGFKRSWYTRLSVRECLGRGVSQQCDEYPFNSTIQGGPENYGIGRVSLKLVNGIHNGAAGRLLNSMFSLCGVSARSETGSAFAAIPVPGGRSGFFCPGQ